MTKIIPTTAPERPSNVDADATYFRLVYLGRKVSAKNKIFHAYAPILDVLHLRDASNAASVHAPISVLELETKWYSKPLVTGCRPGAIVGAWVAQRQEEDGKGTTFSAFGAGREFLGYMEDEEKCAVLQSMDAGLDTMLRATKEREKEAGYNHLRENLAPVAEAYKRANSWQQKEAILANAIRVITGS